MAGQLTTYEQESVRIEVIKRITESEKYESEICKWVGDLERRPGSKHEFEERYRFSLQVRRA